MGKELVAEFLGVRGKCVVNLKFDYDDDGKPIVYYKKIRKLFSRWKPLIQNFNGLLSEYQEREIFDMDVGYTGKFIRVYYFDLFDLTSYSSKLPVEDIVVRDSAVATAEYMEGRALDAEEYVSMEAMDDLFMKKVEEKLAFSKKALPTLGAGADVKKGGKK